MVSNFFVPGVKKFGLARQCDRQFRLQAPLIRRLSITKYLVLPM